VNFEQPVRDVDTEIRVDADQIGIEGGVANFESVKPFETIGWPNCSSASITDFDGFCGVARLHDDGSRSG